MSTNLYELELRGFWILASEYSRWTNQRLQPSDDADCGLHAINDIGGISIHTTSPKVRAACSAFFSRVPHAHLEQAEKLMESV